MQNIERLPKDVVDSIAAGEVLERPANLVKELIENSLDAHATQIDVDLDNGGRWVKISDNGTGISHDQLPLALERHATSKIRSFDDLWTLSTYGFRGEALASAAAVSKMLITSRTPSSESAHRLKNDFGRLSGVDEIAGGVGTTIQIEDLFANIPARLKFLKTDSSEISQIRKVLKAMALVRPEITFRVRSKGELLNFWPATSDVHSRAEQILEKKPLYLAIGEGKGGNRVSISFCAPHIGQRSGQNIWLFAQGRWIQDKSLFAAVMDAYRSLLMHGEFPMAVVRLDCDPAEIDVNVHPTKSQVKFRDSHAIYGLIQRTLRQALEQAPWAPHTQSEAGTSAFAERANAIRNAVESYEQQTLGQSQAIHSAGSLQGFGETHFRQKSSLPNFAEAKSSVAREPSSEYSITPYWSNLQILGQANLTYILAQSRQSLLLVDQHAAHERIAYERLMDTWRSGRAEVQPYLLPLTLHFQPDEIEAILSQQEALEKLKLTVEAGGPTAIAVRSAPAILKESAIQQALQKVAIEVLSQQGSFALEQIISDICATLACHSVVRAGQALSLDEMKALLAQMDEFPLSGYCPHGRPVYQETSFAQLDRQFGRTL